MLFSRASNSAVASDAGDPLRGRLGVAVVAVLVLVSVIAAHVAITDSGPAATVALQVLPAVAYWLACCPLLIRVGGRVPLGRRALVRTLVSHVVVGTAMAWFYALTMAQTDAWLGAFEGAVFAPEQQAFGREIRFQVGLMIYGLIVSWCYVHEFLTQLRAREVAAARLETELAEAQLRALKAQLQPHFLFNTLHAITVLIRRDASTATRMVMQLSDLLRMTLLDADHQEVPLAHELRFLRLYLEIEQTRFRERLRIRWEIEPGIEAAAVPHLVLQPVVENALRHGIEPRAVGGTVTIAASRRDDRLILTVRDDGAGLRPNVAVADSRGVGLRSIRGRLRELYGAAGSVSLAPVDGSGCEVSIAVPYRSFETGWVSHA